MTNVANNTLVYKAVAKGLAMLGDQMDKDNRKLIQMLASLDKLQGKLSKGPAGFKQLANAEKEVDAATQAYAQALHARAAAEQKRTELKKLLDTQLRQNLERDRGDQSALRNDPAMQAGQKSRENRAIANDPTQSYDVRKKALDDYVLYEKQTLQASAQSQIDMLIRQRAQEQKVDAGNRKERQRIAEELAFEIAAIETRSITEQLKIESEGGQTMLAMTEDENARREIAVEAEKKIDRQRIALMKSTSNTLIAANVLTGKETLKIKEAIGKEGLALVQTTGAQEVKQTEKTEEEKAKIRAKVKADLIGFFKEGAKVSDAAFNAAIERIDRESKANQEAADEQRSRVDELEMSGAISKEQADARKAAITQKEEQREKELARQKAAMQKKKTIFEIILNTAAAVVEALPNFILAGIVAAAGAAQLGIAIAQPLPEYAAGTRNHPGGLALVGDGGRPEVVMTPSGGLFRTPANDTLVDLPARSVVFPSVEEAMKNLDLFVPSVADAINSLDPLPKIDSRPDNRTIINIDVDRIVNTQEKNTRVLNQILSGVSRDRANRRFYTLRANLRHTKTFN